MTAVRVQKGTETFRLQIVKHGVASLIQLPLVSGHSQSFLSLTPRKKIFPHGTCPHRGKAQPSPADRRHAYKATPQTTW